MRLSLHPAPAVAGLPAAFGTAIEGKAATVAVAGAVIAGPVGTAVDGAAVNRAQKPD